MVSGQLFAGIGAPVSLRHAARSLWNHARRRQRHRQQNRRSSFWMVQTQVRPRPKPLPPRSAYISNRFTSCDPAKSDELCWSLGIGLVPYRVGPHPTPRKGEPLTENHSTQLFDNS